MNLYLFAVVVLFSMAILGLVVGVSNDAVNFLNSSFGSRVAPRQVILLVAGLGIMAGVTFSSGMMEVARKGIFHPRFFQLPELLVIFLAVMITDVVLLDLFNTFGLPTSTTVSVVFGLLGAAIAVSLLKIFNGDQNILDLAKFINTGKVLAIISGIFISVGIAFACGAVAQYLTRLVFTFDYEKRLRHYGALWGGIALSMISYFILIKGAKGASFVSEPALLWITTHTWTILGAGLVVFTLIFQFMIWLTHINILKPIVLAGTFALALAFAANDLVNFIGVPLAGLYAFVLARQSVAPLTMSMEALEQPLQTNTLFLLIAGVVMVATLWLSRKAQTVTRTELNLGRQDEGLERFESSQLSRIIVRMSKYVIEGTPHLFPKKFRSWSRRRFDRTGQRQRTGHGGAVAEFDLLRASVNLIVASALVATGTNMKLPLSTTYVTFMVAMGTSLADQAWGLENAVYRVTGVLTVIGGWLFTALMALSVSMCFAFAISYLKGIGIIGLLVLLVWVMLRNIKIHGRREEAVRELELLDLKRVTDPDFAVRTSFEHSGRFLDVVRVDLAACMDGILTQDRKKLKALRRETSKVQKWSNTIVANIFKTMRLLQHEDLKRAGNYAYVVYALQEISESLRDMILRCHVHTSNQHAGLLPAQKKELQRLRKCIEAFLAETAAIMLTPQQFDFGRVAAYYVDLKQLLEEFDHHQVERIRKGQSKTRLSILFYGINNDCLKISEQTLQLLTIFNENFNLREKGRRVQTRDSGHLSDAPAPNSALKKRLM